MKRTISILTILFLCFCFSGVGLAAPRPPAKICLSLQGSPMVMILVIKAMGNVRTADGPTQFYTVNGVIINPESTTVPPPWNVPIIGTGHMYTGANEDEFHFSVTGSTALSALDVVRVDLEGYWNVSSHSGFLFFRSSNGIEAVDLLNMVDCDLPESKPTEQEATKSEVQQNTDSCPRLPPPAVAIRGSAADLLLGTCAAAGVVP